MIPQIKQGPVADILDANGPINHCHGSIDLCVQLVTHVNRDEFLLCDLLAAPYIIGCRYMDQHVRDILPLEKLIQLLNWSYPPIVRRALKNSHPLHRPPASANPNIATIKLFRVSSKVKAGSSTSMQPEHQS